MIQYKIYQNSEGNKDLILAAEKEEKIVGKINIVNQSMYLDKKAVRCAILRDIYVDLNEDAKEIGGKLLEMAMKKTEEEKYRYVCMVDGFGQETTGNDWLLIPINRKLCNINSIAISDEDYSRHYMREIDFNEDLAMLEAMHNGYAGRVNYMLVRKTPEYWQTYLKEKYAGNAFILCNSNNMPVALMCNQVEEGNLVVKEFISLLDYENAFDISLYKWLEKKGLVADKIDMYDNVETNLEIIGKMPGRKLWIHINECYGSEGEREAEKQRIASLAEDGVASFHYIEL